MPVCLCFCFVLGFLEEAWSDRALGGGRSSGGEQAGEMGGLGTGVGRGQSLERPLVSGPWRLEPTITVPAICTAGS